MAKRIIGCDIDGVLSDWNKAFQQRLIKVTGKNLIPILRDGTSAADNPPAWLWPIYFGYTKEEFDRTVADTYADENFWYDLEGRPDVDDFSSRLIGRGSQPEEDVYFITTRAGVKCKPQTEAWLETYGFGWPTVLIVPKSENKGLVAAALGLTHFLDDKGSNSLAVKKASPETQVFLLSRNYNAAEQKTLVAEGVIVVDSILDFMAVIEADRAKD